jgi:hypothetical protein
MPSGSDAASLEPLPERRIRLGATRNCKRRVTWKLGALGLLAICLVALAALTGTCIGEASNPGPAYSGLDDSQGEAMDEQLTDDDEAEFSSVDHAIDTETQDGCNFFKAKAFRGPMRGFVFRTCVGGTGYYRDQPPCLTINLMTHLFPRELIVPTGISISDCLTAAELRQNGRQEERRGAAYPRTAPKLTRRGGRGRRGRLDCTMMNADADVAM